MPRILQLAILACIDRRMPIVMKALHRLLDQHNMKLKPQVEAEAFELLKHMAGDLDDAFAEEMTPDEFAAYLVMDAIRCLILSGNYHIYRGILSTAGTLLASDGFGWIKVLIGMELALPDMAEGMVADLNNDIKTSG